MNKNKINRLKKYLSNCCAFMNGQIYFSNFIWRCASCCEIKVNNGIVNNCLINDLSLTFISNDENKFDYLEKLIADYFIFGDANKINNFLNDVNSYGNYITIIQIENYNKSNNEFLDFVVDKNNYDGYLTDMVNSKCAYEKINEMIKSIFKFEFRDSIKNKFYNN